MESIIGILLRLGMNLASCALIVFKYVCYIHNITVNMFFLHKLLMYVHF